VLIDTHAHLDYPDYDSDRAAVLERASRAGVTEIISIGTRLDSSAGAVALAAELPGLWATVGIHPTEADETLPADYLATLRSLAQRPRVVAIGEIGLDYYRLPERDPALDRVTQVTAYKAAQAQVFRAQLDLAAELKLNVVIHQRDSWEDTLTILRDYTGRVRGVFHCFGGTTAQAEELFALGHLVSFTGIITFKNAEVVRETVRQIPLNQFMVETDCPYLAPIPHRGKRCEPAYTRLVSEQIAAVRGISLAEVAEATTATARGFFNF
jgi:TatD DNase family protein